MANPALPHESAADALIGRVLSGRYLLQEVIAEGGMATVYRAVRVVARDEVAVKVMHPQFTRDRGFAQRFRREALIAWKLTHPSIVKVIDHGAEGALYYLVMELLDGEDLFDVLKHEKRLSEAAARRIVIDVCDALAEAHGQGIVHRDLKPENVFLSRTRDGGIVVKVLDFGVAKMMLPDERNSNDSEPVLTAMGALLGTPEYLSPEMCRGEPVGPRADIYACGVLLYALVTGRPPFVTDKPLEVTIKHISEAPVPPSEHRPGLDPALDAIILQALAKQPAQRQASAATLAEALRALGPAPPLPASLLRGEARPRHSPEAATLALPGAEVDETLPAQLAPTLPPEMAAKLATSVRDGEPGRGSPNPSGAPTAHAKPAAQPAPTKPAAAEVKAPSSVTAPSRLPEAKPSVAERAPSTLRPPTPAAAQSLTRVVLAVIVLIATFSAGFIVGRWSAQAAPHGIGAAK